MPLRSADSLLTPAVQSTIDALQVAPEDAGAVKLVFRYAAEIDRASRPAEALERLGPKLLAALESLGATPKARAALRKGDTVGRSRGKLADIRAARRPA